MFDWLQDIGKFKFFEGKQVLKDVGRNPERLALGAVDPASSGLWGGITGKDYKPLVDQMGGTTDANMDAADRAGINTKPGRNTEKAAHLVAALFAGNYAANALGGAGGAGGASGAAGSTGGSASGATNPALIESAVGTPGYGASSAGPGGMGSSSALTMGQKMQLAQSLGNALQQGSQQPQFNGAVPVRRTQDEYAPGGRWITPNKG